jgi:toxin ParE1/3/4
VTPVYRFTPNARRGFREVVAYVEENFGSAIADRVITELEKAFELLAAHPDAGHARTDITRDDSVLFWSVGPTLIAYRESPNGVEILFIERGELDWERLLTDHLK